MGGLGRVGKRSSAGGDSASTKLCGYYTLLVGVLARLLAEANFVRFLPLGVTGSEFSKFSYIYIS